MGLLAILAVARTNQGVGDAARKEGSTQIYEKMTAGNQTVKQSLKPAENGKILLPQIEIDIAEKYYLAAGYGKEEAKDLAVQNTKEINVLYQEAIANGYSVTDQEIRKYLQELKEQYQTAENKKDIQAFMEKSGNEQPYWDYQFEIYSRTYGAR